MHFIAELKPESEIAKKLDSDNCLAIELFGAYFTKDLFGKYSANITLCHLPTFLRQKDLFTVAGLGLFPAVSREGGRTGALQTG